MLFWGQGGRSRIRVVQATSAHSSPSGSSCNPTWSGSTSPCSPSSSICTSCNAPRDVAAPRSRLTPRSRVSGTGSNRAWMINETCCRADDGHIWIVIITTSARRLCRSRTCANLSISIELVVDLCALEAVRDGCLREIDAERVHVQAIQKSGKVLRESREGFVHQLQVHEVGLQICHAICEFGECGLQ